MNDLLDWAVARGTYVVGLGEVALFLALLLWKELARFSVREALIIALGSVVVAAGITHLHIGFPFPPPHLSTANVFDYFMFREVTNGATPLIAVSYSFLLFALIKAFRSEEG